MYCYRVLYGLSTSLGKLVWEPPNYVHAHPPLPWNQHKRATTQGAVDPTVAHSSATNLGVTERKFAESDGGVRLGFRL